MSDAAVVVGASVAGVRVAESLRRAGFQGPVVLIGEEDQEPYDKPPLSKHFLTGEWDAERITLLSRERAAELGIELTLGRRAVALDQAANEVVLDGGHRIRYRHLVVATGASARPSPWRPESGVHVLRSIADARALKRDLEHAGRVVVVGGGFIGSEVAGTARHHGCEVVVVDPSASPMERVMGRTMGDLVGQVHEVHGVHTRWGVGVEAVTGRAGALTVELSDGTTLGADTVVVGIGAVPNDEWLRSSGLIVDNGVLCDPYCQAVGANNVYVAGDVARWLHLGKGESTRLEHWTNAIDQASCVAHNIVHPDQRTAYTPTEYVWSDQYDWRVQIVGVPSHAQSEAVVVLAEGRMPQVAALFGGETGGLIAGVTVNWPRALVECRRLVAQDVSVLDAKQRLDALAAAASAKQVVHG